MVQFGHSFFKEILNMRYSNNLYHAQEFNNIKEIIYNSVEQYSKNIDKLRSNHYKHYTGKVWGDNQNYDLCINSDTFGVEKAADMICEIAMKK